MLKGLIISKLNGSRLFNISLEGGERVECGGLVEGGERGVGGDRERCIVLIVGEADCLFRFV